MSIFVDLPNDEQYHATVHNCIKQSLEPNSINFGTYNGEDYYLRLGSGHRFSTAWDSKLIEMISQLQNDGYQKPIITTFASSYEPDNDPGGRDRRVWKILFDGFDEDNDIKLSAGISQEMNKPSSARFLSPHFAFSIGAYSEVQFTEETMTATLRAYTHGFDLFMPHMTVLWHVYDKPINTKLTLDGMGTERTIEDYEKYAGIRLDKQMVQTYTLKHLDPPNPLYSTEEGYENSFLEYK